MITFVQVCDFVGTLAFAISGVRLASAKHFDLFGAFICGATVAVGGGTVRDLLLSQSPFWMTNPFYIFCTALALLWVICFRKYLNKQDLTWFIFDSIGLALFTVTGIEKTLSAGFPFWTAIFMGALTGAGGGVFRDVFINEEPLIFRKEIYAMACVIGGLVYWGFSCLDVSLYVTVVASFVTVCAIRLLAVKYHISLPTLRDEEENDN